jgi:hypothetical protein
MISCCEACAAWGPLFPDGACRCRCHGPAVSAEAVKAIRAAAVPAPPTVIRWAPAVLDATRWPALTPFLLETPDQAHQREFRERLMQEYVQATLLLTPHLGVGNVVSAGGPQSSDWDGVRPSPPAPGT